jgi:hypothetical protein
MYKIKILLAFGLIFNYYQSFSQKNYVILETNLDKSKISQCLSTARRCEAVMLKNSPPTSLAFSSNSTMTNNAINNLSERFIATYPKSKPSSSTDQIIDRVLVKEKPNAIRLTYCSLPKDKNVTSDFVQLVVLFDSEPNPKILDIFVKGKSEVGNITITEREKLPPKKPEVQAPAPVVKATPTKTSTTKTTTKKTTPKKTVSKTPTKTQPKDASKTPPATTPKKK